ncbi:MAG TPA: chemotaxis protein CheW [Spirochaetales bacterium]|nr:chemotaxis protein CheW [Spirochaetales bacterium]
MAVAAITETAEYLTFRLDEEEYAVDVTGVQEILEVPDITRVPKMPDYMCGIINVRGSVVPVVDLRLRFGMAKTEKTIDTCIIVLEIDLNDKKSIIGTLADSVDEVIELKEAQTEAVPEIGTRIKVDFIKAVGKRNDQFIMILDVDKIFSSEELTTLKEKSLKV